MIRVRFWGTRGSMTSPGQDTLFYGGDTPCVELIGYDSHEPGGAMEPGNPQLILDGGSGLATFQRSLMRGACGRGQGELHFLLSHYHWDHVIGFPFFAPMFVKGNRISLYGDSTEHLRACIERLFTSNYSPLKGADNVAADLVYHQIEPEGMDIAGFHVQAMQNRHPGGALTYRIEYGGHTIVYSTDHEVGDPAVETLVNIAHGANLWILDAMYTAAERLPRDNWGHSSHVQTTNLAIEAGVETAVLFHHNPDHRDEILDQMGQEAAQLAAGSQTEVLMGRDGMLINIGG